MTIFAGKMSSGSGDRSVLAPAETTAAEDPAAEELSKGSRIRYTRAFLVSLAKMGAEIEPSVLSELDDFRLDHSWQSSYDSDPKSCHENQHKGLLSSENVGLLGPGSLLGVHGNIADATPPKNHIKVEEDIFTLLHKSKEPYRPPHLLKAYWNDYKDELWVSPEYLSKNGQKQNGRRDFSEVKKEGQKEAFQDKKKKNSSEHDKKVDFIMPLDMSDEIIESLAPEQADTTTNHTTSPAIEENPAYCISCTEGSELIAHGASNEHSTTFPDKHIKSTTDEASELYGCNIPAFILGVLACVGLEHIFKPETKEIRCSMLWDGCPAEDGKQNSGNHHGSHHLILLPEKGTEQKDMTASADLNITTDELPPSVGTTCNNKLKFVSKGYGGQLEKNLTGEQSSETSSTKGLQLTDASSCIQLSSVGVSTMKNVSKTCKFFPVANKNHLASAIRKYKPIAISSSTDQSKKFDDQSVYDDAELNPVCCSDDKDTLPLELCLPDEDSLITVDDFRIVTYKDMLEKNQVKADKVTPSAPVDSSGKLMDTKTGIKDEKSTHVYKPVAPVYQGKIPYRALPDLINSQVKAINPKFKPQKPANQALSTNVLPTTFHQSQASPYQQTVPTTYYMPELYQVQAFPWNYQMSSYGCVPLPVVPTTGVYGGTNLLGTQSNAAMDYYIGWQ